MKFGVLQFPGSCDEIDALDAARRVGDAELIWHGDRDLDDWMDALGATLVVNGSYFTRRGTPDTPFISAGIPSGPADYDARHGAFVASGSSAGVELVAS